MLKKPDISPLTSDPPLAVLKMPEMMSPLFPKPEMSVPVLSKPELDSPGVGGEPVASVEVARIS